VIYEIARPLLFALDPEKAHDFTLRKLAQAHRLGATRMLGCREADDPIDVLGLRFRNPVGLGAGLDKNGACIDAFGALGFGFVEVGTVTPRPQAGNPKPRLFRLPGAQALINRFGFNNDGLEKFVANVAASESFSAQGGVIGLNIGKNADTPLERALDDYVTCLRGVYPLLIQRPGYVTVNISSPNTRGLRKLQDDDALRALLMGLRDERHRLADQHSKRVPMAVKIAPDLNDADLPRVADTLLDCEVDAIIATNTTVARERVTGLAHGLEAGGLSGAPLLDRSTAVVAVLARHLRGRLPIIGVGGILSGRDAAAKIAAGASLVQIYTGLIYRGPALVGECRRELLRRRPQPPWTHGLESARVDS
jgi:dihydroorotate dehydrogenase